jgi:ubiquinone/menaquinone biosynthesis C-methylase UbiE
VPRIVAAYYDRLWSGEGNASWNCWPFFQRQPSATKYALDLLGDLRGKKVLELACGAGHGSCDLAGRGAEVCAVDLSEVGLKKTISLAGANDRGDRVRAVLARADQLPFADESFDIVFAQNFLMHVSPREVGREMWRVLRPHGKVVVVEPLAHHPLLRIYRLCFSDYRKTRPKWATHTDIRELSAAFGEVRIRMFYLAAAAAGLGFIQRHPRLLAPTFTVLDAVDRLATRVAPSVSRFAWVAVADMAKGGNLCPAVKDVDERR